VPGLEHRIGGLEKADGSGNVSYDGINHERMVHLRQDKIAGIANDIPLLEVNDETGDAQLLLVSWGSTYAAVAAGVKRVRARGMKVAHAHLRHLNPFPSNLGEVLGQYSQVMVPEINLGQLSRILRSEFLVDAKSMNKMQGVPFRVGEIESAITMLLGGNA
jgi:2-oxoglutarate ferredoxin oxidoreductase subunit alpha